MYRRAILVVSVLTFPCDGVGQVSLDAVEALALSESLGCDVPDDPRHEDAIRRSDSARLETVLACRLEASVDQHVLMNLELRSTTPGSQFVRAAEEVLVIARGGSPVSPEALAQFVGRVGNSAGVWSLCLLGSERSSADRLPALGVPRDDVGCGLLGDYLRTIAAEPSDTSDLFEYYSWVGTMSYASARLASGGASYGSVVPEASSLRVAELCHRLLPKASALATQIDPSSQSLPNRRAANLIVRVGERCSRPLVESLPEAVEQLLDPVGRTLWRESRDGRASVALRHRSVEILVDAHRRHGGGAELPWKALH